MGRDTMVEHRSYCKDGKNSKTISASHQLVSKVEKNGDKRNIIQRDPVLRNARENLTKLRNSVPRTTISGTNKSISYHSSVKSVASRASSGQEPKRVAAYQSLESLRQMKMIGAIERTRKIQSLCNSDSFLTYTIVDSLPRPNLMEASPVVRKSGSLIASFNACQKSGSIGMNHIPLPSIELSDQPFQRFKDTSITKNSFDGLSKIPMDSKDLDGVVKFKCNLTSTLENDGKALAQRDLRLDFSKPSSMKVEIPKMTCPAELYHMNANSKSLASQLQDTSNMNVASKTLQYTSLSERESSNLLSTGSECIKKNETLHRLNDFLKIDTNTVACNVQSSKPCRSQLQTSAVHLHGLIKVECRRGSPYFELSLNGMEDDLVAKTWRLDSAFKWLYTFYSINSKRKCRSKRGKRDSQQSIMVGQMLASCYLCSGVKDAASFGNSAMMEFTLYDISHAKKIFAGHEHLIKDSDDSGLSAPWASANLHSNLEVAAIAIHIPFEKSGNLKNLGDEVADGISNSASPVNIEVITASGTHGLANNQEAMPSPLLQRWKLSGACDCGGWDMACPVTVFDNLTARNVEESSFMERQRPLELFAQGAKQKAPALSISFIEEGRYAVDFHVQLSAMQAFAICIALLHNVEDSILGRRDSHVQKLRCKSLKSLFQEEARRILLEAVKEEEKINVAKRREGFPQYLAFNPPFSPISRA